MPRRFTRLLEALPATIPFVAPDALERRMGRPLRVRLGANESSFGISPRAREAMHRAVEQSSWYGDPEGHDLRAALSARHAADPELLAVASGIDDLLALVVRAFVEPGEGVVASLGSYPTFAYHVRSHGGLLHTVPYVDDANDLEALAEAAARTGARLVYLANPDNPTGSFHGAAAILQLVARIPAGCVLLLDEAYSDFAPAGALPGADQLDPADPRVIRLRTFSKAHGLAGARIGYAVGAPDVIATFDKFRHHFGVNRVALAGALASLEDPDFLAGVVTAVVAGRADYVALGVEVGLPALPSCTNFVALDAGTGTRARLVRDRLLEDGVFVRTPGTAPLDRLVRVTVGTPPERAAFAASLRRVLSRGEG